MSQTDSFLALPLQISCHAVRACTSVEDARAQMAATIETVRTHIIESQRFGLIFSGEMAKLVVLPEYFLTGYPTGETMEAWSARGALHPDGPEYARLGEIAAETKTFLAGNAYEIDPHFPGIYFQASFIFAPDGRKILSYRRLQSLFAPTPFDVWDKYLDIYGLDAVFPVARTEIGNLACIASEEILYPEIARCLALRGAEIFCHSTSEIASALQSQKDVAKKARAQENLAYVISANSAGVFGNGVPAQSSDGRSQIVDHRGKIVTEAQQGETMAAMGPVSLGKLRADRAKPAMENMLARQRLALFAGTYAGIEVQKANRLMTADGDTRVPDRSEFRSWLMETLDSMRDQSILS